MLNDYLTMCESSIAACLKGYRSTHANMSEELFEGMVYAVSGGGKRLRPLLTIASYLCALRTMGKTPTDEGLGAALRLGVALELVHSYSLVHDDMEILDNDAMRRGKAAVHTKYGEQMALLVGDALLNLAFECAAEGAVRTDNPNYARAMKALFSHTGASGMVGGQALDISLNFANATEELITKMYLGKTAGLMMAATEAGATLAGASADVITNLRGFGRDFGLTFQIQDDLLDESGDLNEMGKATGADKERGKVNLVTAFGAEYADLVMRSYRGSTLWAITEFGDKAVELREIVKLISDRKS